MSWRMFLIAKALTLYFTGFARFIPEFVFLTKSIYPMIASSVNM